MAAIPPALATQEIDAAFEKLKGTTPNDQEAFHAVRYLAASSKQDPAIRQRLAEDEVLQRLVEIVESGLDNSRQATDFALRCIGNACADNDAARATITALGFRWTLRCLRAADESVELQCVTTQVLYNICRDYEPAQQACYREQIHVEILRLIYSPASRDVDKDNMVDLVFWIVGHKESIQPQDTEGFDMALLRQMLTETAPVAGLMDDVDTYAALIETTLVFMRDATIQRQVIECNCMPDVWQFIEHWAEAGTTKSADADHDEETMKLMLPLGTNLVWIASDLAARPEYAVTYPLDGAFTRSLVEFLIHEAPPRNGEQVSRPEPGKSTSHVISGTDMTAVKVTAACQILGNLLWALRPEDFAGLVEQDHLETAPFLWLATCDSRSPTSVGVMHAAAGLLIHLSRPSTGVREVMGSESNARTALERLCRHDMPEVKQDGVKLLRALGKDCPANQMRFVALAKEVTRAASEGEEGKSTT